jgi:hypothetical protein
MKVEVTVTVTVEAGKDWQDRAFNALTNVASEIYHNPQFNSGKGDSNNYVFEYQMKGVPDL